jgi:hypothetical protein
MWMKRTNSRTVLAALVFALACMAMPATTPAQTDYQKGPSHNPIERIATGKVVNKNGDPIGGAVVYLKDSRSNSVKTYIADDDGQFRFGELSPDTDYEIWAESNGVRSKSREISSFDNDSSFYFTLRINVSKSVSLDGPSIDSSNLIPQP